MSEQEAITKEINNIIEEISRVQYDGFIEIRQKIGNAKSSISAYRTEISDKLSGLIYKIELNYITNENLFNEVKDEAIFILNQFLYIINEQSINNKS